MEIVKVVVHEFLLGDVDDPEIYAAQPIWEWQQTDAGKWVMENSVEQPSWGRAMDYNTWGMKYRIVAKMHEKDAVFFKLKFYDQTTQR